MARWGKSHGSRGSSATYIDVREWNGEYRPESGRSGRYYRGPVLVSSSSYSWVKKRAARLNHKNRFRCLRTVYHARVIKQDTRPDEFFTLFAGGGHSKKDLRYTQKPIHFPIFTHSI